MPGRDPSGTLTTHLITTTQIDNLVTKVTAFNTAKTVDVLRIST